MRHQDDRTALAVEVFEKLVVLAPHARVLRLENSGHQGFMEEPVLVANTFREFLDSIPEASSGS